jgi:hypothetical protein
MRRTFFVIPTVCVTGLIAVTVGSHAVSAQDEHAKKKQRRVMLRWCRHSVPLTEPPGPYFQKEFFHNGYIKSLKQLVHFYSTRDVFPFDVTSGHCPTGKTEKVDCWPEPEVPNNIDMTVGSLGLTDHEEDLIVTFLQTLTDVFTTPYPDIDTFTGTCMSGSSAATQGNELLIPTPPLPPWAAAVCDVAPTPGPSPVP